MPAESGYAAFLRDLPPDWPVAPIAEVARVVGGGTPSRDVGSFWNGSIPWVTPGEISAETAVFLNETREHISPAGLAGSGATLLPAGSLMITTRATLGARAINLVPMTTNQGFKSLVFPDPEDSQFFYYLTEKLKPELKRRASGTTFLEVSGGELARIRVPVPPKGERTQIAVVLDTLDTTIRQTEAIIAKLKQVKQGLLHDLLTRGIDDNGELRPPQCEAPDLYKESALGWVPREWVVRPANEVCEAVIDCKNRTPPEAVSGLAVIRTPNVRNGRFVRTGLALTDPESFEIWTERGRPKVGDVLITREAPVGEVCLLPEDIGPACLGQRMMMYRPAEGVLRNDFMLVALISGPIQKLLADLSGGSTVGHVRVGDIRFLPVPVPSLGEQHQIAIGYMAVEGRMETEEATLAKLLAQRDGLMDDLLTGRVRVTPLLQRAPA